jgi:peptidoglycan/LPS O-acetylase OafA/YrhL
MVLVLALHHTETVKAWTGHSELALDYITGIATALCLWLLRGDPDGIPWSWWQRSAAALSAFSYTLYISHFPLLIFMRAVTDTGRPWDVSAATCMATIGLTGMAMMYAAVLWWVCESRTGAVRDYARALLTRNHA